MHFMFLFISCTCISLVKQRTSPKYQIDIDKNSSALYIIHLKKYLFMQRPTNACQTLVRMEVHVWMDTSPIHVYACLVPKGQNVKMVQYFISSFSCKKGLNMANKLNEGKTFCNTSKIMPYAVTQISPKI